MNVAFSFSEIYLLDLPFEQASTGLVFISGLPTETTVLVLQLLQGLCYCFPAISLLFRMGAGRLAGRVLEKIKLRLTQPSLVELGLGLSLAKAK